MLLDICRTHHMVKMTTYSLQCDLPTCQVPLGCHGTGTRNQCGRNLVEGCKQRYLESTRTHKHTRESTHHSEEVQFAFGILFHSIKGYIDTAKR